jgi:hypothetical protein
MNRLTAVFVITAHGGRTQIAATASIRQPGHCSYGGAPPLKKEATIASRAFESKGFLITGFAFHSSGKPESPYPVEKTKGRP